jgi:hypothetical protein
MKSMAHTETLSQNFDIKALDRSSEPAYDITASKDNQGLYYEAHGLMKLSSTSWRLVTYINLQRHVSEYQQLLSHYTAAAQVCTNTSMSKHPELSRICDLFVKQFNRVTITQLYEIESNYHSLMLAIGYNPHDRARRGLKNAFGRMANVLYGMCSKIDTTFLMDKIIDIGKGKLESLNLINEKTILNSKSRLSSGKSRTRANNRTLAANN